MAMKTADKASISITRAISTKEGLKETERNKVCTRVIRKKSYELVRFLSSYKVHPFKFAIHSGGCKVRVNNKTSHAFRTDLLVQSSKLLLYTLVILIWCSYFIQKTTIFNHRIFQVLFSKFPKSTTIRKWPKHVKLINKASQNT